MTDHSDLCLQKEEVHRTETCSTGPEVNVHSQPSTPVINVQNHFKQYDCRASLNNENWRQVCLIMERNGILYCRFG